MNMQYSQASYLAVKALADQLSIKFKTDNHAKMLAQDAEVRIASIIQPVLNYFENSANKHLTTDLLNQILRSQNLPPIFGFDEHCNLELSSLQSTTDDAFYVYIDKKKDLNEMCQEKSQPDKRPIELQTHYKYINGNLITSTNLGGFISGDSGITSIMGIRSIDYPIAHSSSQLKENEKEEVSPDLEAFYRYVVEQLSEPDTTENLFKDLVHTGCLNAIIPHLLRFFIARISTNLDKFVPMSNLGKAVVSLLINKTVPVDFYAHAFIRIGFCFATKDIYSGTVGEDCMIRDIGANIISLVCDRCLNSYPNLHVECFNQFNNIIFSEVQSVSVLYGAVSGIFALGSQFTERLMPHLIFTIKYAHSISSGPDTYLGMYIKLVYDEMTGISQQSEMANSICLFINKEFKDTD